MDSLVGYVATGAVSLVVGLLLRETARRVNVAYWVPHFALFSIPQPDKPPIILRTDSLAVQNLGRKTATNVQIIFKRRPDHLQLAPQVPHTVVEAPYSICLPSLGAREHVMVQVFSFASIPELELVRSDAGVAQQIAFQMQRQFPRWLQFLFFGLLLVGSAFTLYWLIRAAMFISGEIGIV